MAREFVTQRGATRVVFGAGCLGRAGEELDRLGFSRVLVVGTPGRRAEAEAAAALIGNRSVGVLAIAKEHVPRAIAEEGVREATRLRADAVLAIGGGSGIGLAKAIALETGARVVNVPTTYSGSEMTPMWGLTDGNVKKTGRDERVRAALVLYDVELGLRLPLGVSVASAWNALAHAVEALWAPKVDPALAVAAERSIALFARALPRIVLRPDDREAREEALEAAYLAGVAIAEGTMGLHHKICHVLGGRGMPHAETHAALIPHVVRFNREAAPEAMKAIARALGVADPTLSLASLARTDPVAGIFALATTTNAPSGLGALGLARDAIPEIARIVLAGAPPNPRPLDEDNLRALLEGAWEKTTMPDAKPSPAATRSSATAPETTLQGFGSALLSEALPGAVPRSQNAPRKSPYGLYPELVNGVPFTTRRVDNTRLWLYRIRPASVHTELVRLPEGRFGNTYDVATPNRLRWKALPIPGAKVDFLDGLSTLGGLGDPASAAAGWAVHLYAASASMGDRSFTNADGDMLIVPQEGTLVARTECGVLHVSPGEIFLVPRGLRVTIDLADETKKAGARGWMTEVFGARFKLPERGLIGSNGLADPRHFHAPTAAYEDRACPGYRIVHKLGGQLWAGTQERSPYDVVGWHGNHVPFKYDLLDFNAMGSVTFDHPDPSIHTVLTAPLDDHGRAICDFVCFRGRWDCLEHSFRPPFAHRNAATEVNGVVAVESVDDGYAPGCTFLTPLLTAHGVATRTYEAVFAQPEETANVPRRIPDESMWIMFESALPFRVSRWALETEHADPSFAKLFDDPKSHFTPTKP